MYECQASKASSILHFCEIPVEIRGFLLVFILKRISDKCNVICSKRGEGAV